MTTLTFQIEVNDDLGVKLSPNSIERKKLNILLKSLINSSNTSSQSFMTALNLLSDEAKTNGLTDDILDDLIKETEND